MRKLTILSIVICFVLAVTSGVFATTDELKEVTHNNERNLKVEVGGADIIFDETSEQIFISKDLMAEVRGDQIKIYSDEVFVGSWPFNKPRHKIVIGTARQFDEVIMELGGAKISGLLKTSELNIESGGMVFNATVYADTVQIEGAGIELLGLISATSFTAEAAGMDIKVDLENTERVELTGVGLSATIKYLDAWVGHRYLEVEGLGGTVHLLVPGENDSDNKGILEIDKGKMIKVEYDHY